MKSRSRKKQFAFVYYVPTTQYIHTYVYMYSCTRNVPKCDRPDDLHASALCMYACSDARARARAFAAADHRTFYSRLRAAPRSIDRSARDRERVTYTRVCCRRRFPPLRDRCGSRLGTRAAHCGGHDKRAATPVPSVSVRPLNGMISVSLRSIRAVCVFLVRVICPSS